MKSTKQKIPATSAAQPRLIEDYCSCISNGLADEMTDGTLRLKSSAEKEAWTVEKLKVVVPRCAKSN